MINYTLTNVLKKLILKNQCCEIEFWQRGILLEGTKIKALSKPPAHVPGSN